MKRAVLTLTAAALLLPAATAGAHGSAPAGLSEHELEQYETATLGKAHAEEHAEQRRLLEQPAIQRQLAQDQAAGRAAYARDLVSANAATDGAWSPPIDLPRPAINAAMLPTGKVLMYSRPPAAPGITLWDPTTNDIRTITPDLGTDDSNIFCSGFTFLPDGRLVVVGGQIGPEPPDASVEFKGWQAIFTFNPFNETWTRQPNMRHGRWYPTTSLTADGRVIVADGLDESGTRPIPDGASNNHNNDIEVFTPSADPNGVGTVQVVQTRVENTEGEGLGDQPPSGSYYPHMALMPSGRTLVYGPDPKDSWAINPLKADGSWNGWENTPNSWAYHGFGSGVLLPSDTPGSSTVMLIGGSSDNDDPARKGKYVETWTEGADSWQPSAGRLNVDREHHNTVILPDGSMVSVGGGTGYTEGTGLKYDFVPDNLKVDLWNPADGQWRFGAAQSEGRTYHSTALLLPDGRVMSAGDDGNDRGGTPGDANARLKDTAEVYSPPYLFKGARPRITARPAQAAWGSQLTVGYDQTDVAKAVLVAPGADTHATDMNQRYVPLPVVANNGSTLTLQGPPNANQAPPGYYMLFLVNAQGVPSVAQWVQIGATASPTVNVVGGGTAPGGGGQTPPSTGGTAGQTKKRIVKVGKLKSMRLRTLLRKGLTVKVTCTRRCNVAAKLTLTTGKGKKAKTRTLAGKGALLRKAGTKRLKIKLGKKAKRTLKRQKKPALQVRVTATDTTGFRQTTKQRLKVKR